MLETFMTKASLYEYMTCQY